MIDQLVTILQGGILQPLSFTAGGTAARVLTIIDILLVTILLTTLFRFLRRTRATNILTGVLIVGVGIVVARLLNLAAMNLVLTVFLALLLFSLPMLFQPELRRGLERLGRLSPFRKNGDPARDRVFNEIAEATERLRTNRRGAILVLERNTGLTEYIDTGIHLHADIRASLLEAIFASQSPLHDGAVILRGDTCVAAGCTLPLADEGTSGRLGTRHRAALGISEVSDAIAIVVSEERRTVSVAADGRLFHVTAPQSLTNMLRKLTSSR